MGLHFEIDPNDPIAVVDDMVPQLEMLADLLSFSGDDFQLSDLARAGFAETLLAVSRGLQSLPRRQLPSRGRPDLRAV